MSRASEEGLNLRVVGVKEELADHHESDVEPTSDRKSPKQGGDSRPKGKTRKLCPLLYIAAERKLRVVMLCTLLFLLVITAFMTISSLLSPKLEELSSKNKDLQKTIAELEKQVQNLTLVSHSRKRTIESLQKQLEIQSIDDLDLPSVPTGDFFSVLFYTGICMIVLGTFVYFKIQGFLKEEKQKELAALGRMAQQSSVASSLSSLSANTVDNQAYPAYGSEYTDSISVPMGTVYTSRRM